MNFVDPTGLAPGDKFGSIEEAAEDWKTYTEGGGEVSTGEKIDLDSAEYSSAFLQGTDEEGNKTFSYTPVIEGERDTFKLSITKSEASMSVGTIYNHNEAGVVSKDQALYAAKEEEPKRSLAAA